MIGDIGAGRSLWEWVASHSEADHHRPAYFVGGVCRLSDDLLLLEAESEWIVLFRPKATPLLQHDTETSIVQPLNRDEEGRMGDCRLSIHFPSVERRVPFPQRPQRGGKLTLQLWLDFGLFNQIVIEMPSVNPPNASESNHSCLIKPT